jgi:septum formation protein
MIILASTSPTRRALLEKAGVSFTAVAPAVDEWSLIAQHPDWSPDETALKLAEAKAIEVSVRYPEELVIGADQVLALGTRIYGKPDSIDQCRQHLLELQGKTHALISSVVCAQSGAAQWSHSAKAMLRMRGLSEDFVDIYMKQVGDDCMSSVGGYKIEGLGIQLFDNIVGDHFTILGLPLLPLIEFLRLKGEIPS